MKIGIVGNAEDKFDRHTRRVARRAIRSAIKNYKPSHVISGGCHLGGVDIWAAEIAEKLGVETIIHEPRTLGWERGYKPRNLLIANGSDLVICVVVADYPKDYDGQRFIGSGVKTARCYHCELRRPPHVKSGGCWTAMHCGLSEWLIVDRDGWRAVPLTGFFTKNGGIMPASVKRR